jgi:hypothetical protein
MGLLERTVASVPGWQAAWDGAEILSIEQAKGDVVLTLERAYVDVNQVMVFLSVSGLAPIAANDGQVTPVWSANLVGPTGRQMLWSTGGGSIVTPVAAIVEAWGPPEAVAGSYELTIDCLEIAGDRPYDDVMCAELLADPWRFAFDLPKPGGAIVSEVNRQTVGGATVSLIELRVSETMLTAKLALTVAGADATSWSTDGSGLVFRHEGGAITSNSTVHLTIDPRDRGPDGDLIESSSPTGLGATRGTWTVEIPELWYVVGDAPPESAIRLTGPWIFEVDVP